MSYVLWHFMSRSSKMTHHYWQSITNMIRSNKPIFVTPWHQICFILMMRETIQIADDKVIFARPLHALWGVRETRAVTSRSIARWFLQCFIITTPMRMPGSCLEEGVKGVEPRKWAFLSVESASMLYWSCEIIKNEKAHWLLFHLAAEISDTVWVERNWHLLLKDKWATIYRVI